MYMEKAREILSSIKQAPTMEEITKKKMELLTEKSIEIMYKKISDMCENISSNYKLDTTENIFYKNDLEDNNLIKKIFFDNLESHRKILSKDLGKKGYDISFENLTETENKAKYYPDSDFLYKIKISVKQEIKN